MASYIVKVKHDNSLRRLTLSRRDEFVFSYAQLVNKIRDLFQFPPSTELVLTYVDKDGDVVTMAEDEDLKDALLLQSLNPLRLTLTIINKNSPTAAEGKVDSTAETEKRQLQVSNEEMLQKAEKIGAGEQQPQDSNAEMLEKAEKIGAVQPEQGTTDVNEKSTSVAAAPATENKGGPGAPDAAKNDESEHVLHHRIKCDSCGKYPIAGPRFKSNKKADYDLCRSCFEAPGVHLDEFFKIDRSFYGFEHPRVGRMIRLTPAFSSRNPNYRSPNAATVGSDRCSRRCIPVAAGKPGAGSRAEVVHNGVTCDGCRNSPITGPRFKSTTKLNYDLCLTCFQKSGSSGTGEYSRMDQPDSAALHMLARLASPYAPMCGRRGMWILNPMVSKETVGQSTAEEKETSSAGEKTSTSPREKMTTLPTDALVKQVDSATQSGPKDAPAAKETTTGAESGTILPETGGNYFKQLSDLQGAAVPVPQVDAKAAETKVSGVDSAAVEKQPEAENHGPLDIPAEDDLATFEGLLAKLGAMGFRNQKLNKELLKKNELHLRATLDDLCAAEEWDPILEELQEMGFYDSDINRRLMFKTMAA